MKKSLIRFFSLMLVALTTLGAAAGPVSRRLANADSGRPGLSATVAPAPSAATSAIADLPRPQVRPAAGKSKLLTTATAADLQRKGPRNLKVSAPAASMPNLLGSVIWSESDYFTAEGLYTIPTDDSQEFTRLFRYANAHYGGVLVDDIYFTCQYLEYPGLGAYIFYTGYDMATGKEVYEAMGAYYTYSMTYDATTSTVYAIANIDSRFVLVKVLFDMEQQRVVLDPVGVIVLEEYGLWNSIACDSKGQLWAIYTDCALPQSADDPMVSTGSTLYKLDKTTAVLTKIGETGYDSLYASDAIFDTKTDRLFWTVSNDSNEGFLTEVDTTTARATVIYHFPGNEEVTGLAIPAPEAEDGAPAAVTDVKANFAGASLSGSVDFKAPATLFDGSAGSGSLTYTVKANGEQVATGTTSFGAEVSAPVTVKAAGLYTFTVTVGNEAGVSPAAEVTAFVGAGTPEATSVSAEYADGTMTVSWLPVTSTINGGYIDVDAVTYTVTRYPEKKVVADKISATTFSEKLDIPSGLTSYYYEVVVNSGGLTSAPAQSNVISLGVVVPPFKATFDDSLDGFSVVDANGDGQSWKAIDGCARINFNKTLDMDDWLISPAIKLAAGNLYEIAAIFCCGQSERPERIEVKVGKSADPKDMTTVLLDPTVIDMEEYYDSMDWSTVFMPEADGNYYFGFHGISDMNMYALYVDDFSVTRLDSEDGPAAVADLKAVPGLNGELTAAISFTTPSATISGGTLSELTKVELLRNNSLINTWTAPALDAALTYNDRLPEADDYTYTVVAYSPVGKGAEAMVEVYVGVDIPSAVDGVEVYESGKPGEVTIAWNAVTQTYDSIPLDPSLVKYRVNRIVNGNAIAITGILDATSYTYQAVPAGTQEFVQYAIIALTERGYGDILNCSLSANIPTGTPYKGMTMSNEQDLDRYLLGTNSRGGGAWSVYDNTFLPAQDGDNRLFAMYAAYENSYGDLYTGLITLDGIASPALSFYTFNIGDLDGGVPDTNEITISVRENGTQVFNDVKTVIVSETGPADCWNRVVVDLSAYAGKTIQINFNSIVRAASYTVIDNIKVGSLYANDLSAIAISAPDQVTTGNSFTVDVTVSNDGTNPSAGYSVELYGDSELLATKTGADLAAGSSAVFDFELTMSPAATANVVYYAKVLMAGDENEANNRSANVTVKPVASTLPAATDLAAEPDAGEIRLSWGEPDLASIPADAVTEDFEDALPFSSRYGEWTFVDMDGVPVDGFSNTEIPNIIEGVTKGSFWIWDTNTLGRGDQYLGAHSGTKYLFALYRTDMGRSDEWAISPELNGEAQTISFYAKSYSSKYPEQIKVSYSTGSIEPKDFVVVATINPVAGDWTEYKFNVPDGAKHFAINSCASNSFMLMVDDVTYIPANAPRTVALSGYDVYRNGVRINDALLADRAYTDRDVQPGNTYDYTVVAVYNKGQSVPSNAVSVVYTGASIREVSGSALTIATAPNAIVVTGAEGLDVAVYSVDGKTVSSVAGSANTVITVRPGIYLVKAGTTATTVAVR